MLGGKMSSAIYGEWAGLAGAITFDLALPVIRRARDANLHLARSDAAQTLKVSPHHAALTAKAGNGGERLPVQPWRRI